MIETLKKEIEMFTKPIDIDGIDVVECINGIDCVDGIKNIDEICDNINVMCESLEDICHN